RRRNDKVLCAIHSPPKWRASQRAARLPARAPTRREAAPCFRGRWARMTETRLQKRLARRRRRSQRPGIIVEKKFSRDLARGYSRQRRLGQSLSQSIFLLLKRGDFFLGAVHLGFSPAAQREKFLLAMKIQKRGVKLGPFPLRHRRLRFIRGHDQRRIRDPQSSLGNFPGVEAALLRRDR